MELPKQGLAALIAAELDVDVATDYGRGRNDGLQRAGEIVDAYNARNNTSIGAGVADTLGELARRGYKIGGDVPYGFKVTTDKKDRKILVPNASEQEVIAMARREYARVASYNRVAITLSDRGFRTRTGRRFAAMQVRRMLRTTE